MFSREMTRRSLKLGLALTVALGLGACARNSDDAAAARAPDSAGPRPPARRRTSP